VYPAGDLLKVAKANNCENLVCRVHKATGLPIGAGAAGCEYIEVDGIRAAVDRLLPALNPCGKEVTTCSFRDS